MSHSRPATTTTTTTTVSGQQSSNFLAFVEACVYVYLHNRRVYAAHTFDKRRAFDLVVHQTRNPQLVSYVKEALANVQAWIDNGQLKNICAVLVDQDGEVAERLDFAFVTSSDQELESLSCTVPKDFARAALARLARLQLPAFTCGDFKLAFEISDAALGNEAGRRAEEHCIALEPPDLTSTKRARRTRVSTIPIVSFSGVQSPHLRILVKVETSMLA